METLSIRRASTDIADFVFVEVYSCEYDIKVEELLTYSYGPIAGPISYSATIETPVDTEFFNEQIELQAEGFKPPIPAFGMSDYKFEIHCDDAILLGCFISHADYDMSHEDIVVLRLSLDHIEIVP